MEHLASLNDWNQDIIDDVLNRAADIKRFPAHYSMAAAGKVRFMIFEKPSLRTRVSFETGMARLGGHAINYDVSTSPLGAGKESLSDTIKVVSRYADLIVARLFEHRDLEEMMFHSSVPVINGLTDFTHPCQIMADLLTIREHKGTLRGLKLCFLGDGNNNVTHSLLYGCALMGIDISIGCPKGEAFEPLPNVLEDASVIASGSRSKVEVCHDAREAAKGADVVYTDSWMSYHIDPAERDQRVKTFMPFQVSASIMACADPEAIFMNCLPAEREFEQTAEVIDGPQSVVFDQAENRLYAQNAIMLRLLAESASA
jgi:ornithine carbamoyltransferase